MLGRAVGGQVSKHPGQMRTIFCRPHCDAELAQIIPNLLWSALRNLVLKNHVSTIK